MESLNEVLFSGVIFNLALVIFICYRIHRSKQKQALERLRNDEIVIVKRNQILEQGKIIVAQEKLIRNKEELIEEKELLLNVYRQINRVI